MYNKFKTKKSSRNPYLKVVLAAFAFVNCQSRVFRPLIGFDKTEIVKIAETIGTFETSILPYEDCCTIFVPKHPETRPKVSEMLRSEEKIAEMMVEMMATAVAESEVVTL